MMMSDAEQCRWCGKTRGWHQENSPHHPFVGPNEDGAAAAMGKRRDRDPQPGRKSSQRGSEAPQIMAMPTDPVLRIALISKGILTPADLIAAEESLKVAMTEITTREV